MDKIPPASAAPSRQSPSLVRALRSSLARIRSPAWSPRCRRLVPLCLQSAPPPRPRVVPHGAAQHRTAPHRTARIMSCCSRAAPIIFVHVSLLLALVAGAGLVTAARLKWDPSTYIAVRELFPTEYRVAAAFMCAASVTLLALGHLAALALATTRLAVRRALFLTYAMVMAVLVCAEVSWAAWSAARLVAWLDSAQAQQLAQMVEVREHLEPILNFLADWHPLPAKIQDLIQEATEDAPRNLYVGGTAVVLAAVLQPAAAVLALLCAAARRRAAPRGHALDHSASFASTENEKAPLKTAFKNGKLVIL